MVTDDLVPIGKESLTPVEFNALFDIPTKLEWLGNMTNPKTRRAYKIDVAEFGEPEPWAYVVAHGQKLVGGASGGWLAGRNRG